MRKLRDRLRRDSGVSLALTVIAIAVLTVVSLGVLSGLRATVSGASESTAQNHARSLARSVNELGAYQVGYAGTPNIDPGACYWWSTDHTRPSRAPSGCTQLTAFSVSDASGAVTEGLFEDGDYADVVIQYQNPLAANVSLGIYAPQASDFDHVPYARVVVTSTASTDTQTGTVQSSDYTTVYYLTFA